MRQYAVAPMMAMAMAAAVVPASAHAGQVVSLTRPSGTGADRAAAQIGRAVHARLTTGEPRQGMDLAATLGNPEAAAMQRSLAAADELMQRGRAAYDSLDLDRAMAALSAGLARYERLAAYLPTVKKVSATLMLLGATHILRGEEKPGIRRLEQAISIDPEVEPDPRVFNPAMRALFAAAKRASPQRPRGGLDLSSSPGNAEVFVDGRFTGITPQVVAGLEEGHHLLRLERDGMVPYGALVEVRAHENQARSAVFHPTDHGEQLESLLDSVQRRLPAPGKSQGDKLDIPQLGELAGLCRADELLLLQVRVTGERVLVAAYRIDAAAGTLTKSAQHTFVYSTQPTAYDEDVALMLKQDFEVGRRPAGAPGAIDLGAIAKSLAPADDAGLMHAGQARCPFNSSCDAFKKVVVGSSLGGGGAALLTGAVFYKLAADKHQAWQRTEQTDPNSKNLAATGRARALTGDILIGAGLGLLVAGSLVWWLWDPQPAAVDIVDPLAPSKAVSLAVDLGSGAGGRQLLVRGRF